METLEATAKMSLIIHLLGGAPDLPGERIDELLDLRENVYHMTGRHPGYEKYSEPGE
jgi:L-fuculose-phosphate aldolase